VIARAFILSWIGFIAAFFAAMNSLQGANGPTGVRGTPSNLTVVVAASLLGGSIGWFIGAVFGWFPRPVKPGPWGAHGLRAAAGWFALIGFASFLVYGVNGAALVAFMIGVGAALVTVTLLVLGQRRISSPSAAVIGATVAIAILAIASMQFSSLLPLDRAWLGIWRAGQAEADSFAPNLLASPPDECSAVPLEEGGDDIGSRRYDSLGLGTWYRQGWLEGHVPRWLPRGFGLLAWGLPPGGATGLWTDARCRQIKLVLFEGNLKDRLWTRFHADDRVGDWAVTSLTQVGAPRLEYLAWNPAVPGEADDEILGLHLVMLGIDRDVGDRIALGIPV